MKFMTEGEAETKRQKAIETAKRKKITNFTHGVAAKLINMYLKVGFVCGGHYENERVKALHPPIDSLLLDTLSKENVGGLKAEWNRFRRVRWSKLSSEQYEDVIKHIRVAICNSPLWTVEQYWPGHR